ncbi:secreted RxLR effector peptide protein, putative [Phytophthora infestans T30-4]|uniref:RxLR effector protein CRE8 n=3 Tax=Phytophthora infestans TaxID=4787 RepID=CRE8_PHYIT|nr:secreted RxLR effector peptide protein, putative [Phytophthora infestans T30-4]D0NBU6.1 RecName: Full=RxLR effector protein CRE8; AltName: Full=Core RXLR effector 8; Flags: Precursor [Phytophthora infestans T30-4]KAF4030997.1 hypothetical protein GN244_ATG17089 [Phytophthora infestans]EEY55251.1 secreted RxLR effector peptide protein, putative [Phytophthora infestans T30-4]KAF4134824.1 hypothetical protein GN958_ATG16080 [Phytophthora infestans]KAI9990923.1 hypothetical protein PInf_018540 |eukprot:XP_002903475.1 secreted RxLR effector peptide protein, putative [Phytophthora infestans T30-4]
MRLPSILVVAASTLFLHYGYTSASPGADAVLTGAVSLGFLQLVGADQSVIEQPRFLRDGKIAEGDNEERVNAQKEAAAKVLDQVFKTKSLSPLDKLEKTSNLAVIRHVAAMVDDKVDKIFAFADAVGMGRASMLKMLKGDKQFTDAERLKTVKRYVKFLIKKEQNNKA